MCDAERGPACERGQCKKVYSGTSDSHPDALVASPSTASLVGVIDRSRTIQDITNLDWKSAVACHYMAGGLGSCGAFCVQLADGTWRAPTHDQHASFPVVVWLALTTTSTTTMMSGCL